MEQISQTISVINATSAFIILLSATAEQKDLRLFFLQIPMIYNS